MNLFGKVVFQYRKTPPDTIHFEKSIVYEVTEITQMGFGSSTITFTTENKKEIPTNDLGPNNKRIVKEKIIYKKRKQQLQQPEMIVKAITLDTLKVKTPQPLIKTVIVKPIETYERMVDNGLQTVEMLEVLANEFYYKYNYTKAAKYFEKLFAIAEVTDEDNIFKYKQCLKYLEVENQQSNNKPKTQARFKKRQ